MRATVDVALYFPGVFFRVTGRGHHANPASIPLVVRAPEYSLNVGPPAGFRHRPTGLLRVPNRCADVLVWVIGHDSGSPGSLSPRLRASLPDCTMNRPADEVQADEVTVAISLREMKHRLAERDGYDPRPC